MMRFVVFLPVFLVFPSQALAQEPGKAISLAVGPAGLPDPSLKYRLLPDMRTLRPGNAATLYYRTLAMFVENQFLLKELKEAHWYEWQSTPLVDLPLEQMRAGVHQARYYIQELAQAALLRECDWYLHNRKEGIGLLLPDVQGMRMLGNVLAVKARLQIAEKDHAGAIETLQIGYTLGRHMSKGETIIHTLVGVAIARLMDRQLEALIQQPDAPNLYWALTAMPRPLFDFERAVHEETRMLENTWPWLGKLEEGPMTLAQVQDGLLQLEEMLKSFSVRLPGKTGKMAQAFVISSYHEEARRKLLGQGFTEEKLEAMPNVQVVALWAYREYRISQEELLKWTYAENGTRHPGFLEAQQSVNTAVKRIDRLFFHGLLTALGGDFGGYNRVFEVTARDARRRAALRCVEAIRLHAALNRGEWPRSLEEITSVPVPDDPLTRKPFQYTIRENRAILSSPLRPGEKPDSQDMVAYELRLRE